MPSEKNMNIPEVNISDITKGFKFRMYDNNLTITKDYEKNGEERYVKAVYTIKDSKNAFVILDKDVIINYLKNH